MLPFFVSDIVNFNGKNLISVLFEELNLCFRFHLKNTNQRTNQKTA